MIRNVFSRPSRARRESNQWLKEQCGNIEGQVLSIGSEYDADGEGGYYRDYFRQADSYTTSEVTDDFGCDLVIDVRTMHNIADESYACVYCSGVLEHVADCQAGFRAITRILKKGGVLLLGLPFRQVLHMAPNDFWRFTEYGIRILLKEHYKIVEIVEMDRRVKGFPAAYWVKAIKL